MISVDEFRSVLRWHSFRDPRRRCPHCRARLWARSHLVIATRHCPYCGGAVLIDPDPTPNGDLPTEADFHLANQTYQGRSGCVVIAGLMLWLGGGCLTAVLVGVVRPALAPDWVTPLLLWTAVGWPVLAAGAAFVVYYRARQDWRLACHSCRAFLARWGGLTVSASGRCPACGRRALAEPEPDDLPDDIALAPTAPPLTVAEFARRATTQERASVRGWTLFVVLWALFEVPALAPLFVLGRFEVELRLSRWLGDDDLAYQLVQYGFLGWFFATTPLAIALGAWTYLRVVRRNPLECPHCRKSYLLPRLVLAGRRCDRCLEVAVLDG